MSIEIINDIYIGDTPPSSGGGGGGGGGENLNETLIIGNNAGGLAIKNIGTPVDDKDATTKEYVDSLITIPGEQYSILASQGNGTGFYSTEIKASMDPFGGYRIYNENSDLKITSLNHEVKLEGKVYANITNGVKLFNDPYNDTDVVNKRYVDSVADIHMFTSHGEFDAALNTWNPNNIGAIISKSPQNKPQPFYGQGSGRIRLVSAMIHKHKTGQYDRTLTFKIRCWNITKQGSLTSEIPKTGSLPDSAIWKDYVILEPTFQANTNNPFYYDTYFNKLPIASSKKFSELDPTWEDTDDIIFILTIDPLGDDGNGDWATNPTDVRVMIGVQYGISGILSSSGPGIESIIDTNNDGVIDINELRKAVLDITGDNHTNLQDVIKIIDDEAIN